MAGILENGYLCTGCSACVQVCINNAVRMKTDDEGFSYPEIDKNICNDCGLCRNTCPVQSALKEDTDTDTGGRPLINAGSISAGSKDDRYPTDAAGSRNAVQFPSVVKVYACFSEDPDIRERSSSGGVFSLLALNVLGKGGVVFGAGFDKDFMVRHGCVENVCELDRLRRSKYVQSDTGNTFSAAGEFLTEGRIVLYCGTPCQIAGLKAFLKKEYSNLVTCDIACHGVPSPGIWAMYLDFIKKRYGSDIDSISFRDKSTGWKNSSMRITFKNGRQYTDRVKNETFFIGFGKGIFNRRSCFNCKFRVQNSKADITLADFWGIERQKRKSAVNGGTRINRKNAGINGQQPDFKDNKGVSLVITHTRAGEAALKAAGDRMHISERSFDEALKGNPRLVSSCREPDARKHFFNDVSSGYTFDMLGGKYMDNFSIKYKMKSLVKAVLGPDLPGKIRSMLRRD